MPTYKYIPDSKRPLLEVPDTDTTRIAILDRSSRYRRVNPRPVAVAPVEEEGDGLDGMTVPALKGLAEAEKVEIEKGAKKGAIIEAIRAARVAAENEDNDDED